MARATGLPRNVDSDGSDGAGSRESAERHKAMTTIREFVSVSTGVPYDVHNSILCYEVTLCG